MGTNTRNLNFETRENWFTNLLLVCRLESLSTAICMFAYHASELLSVQELLLQNCELLWLCSHGLESRSERHFGTWFSPFLIWKPDFSPWMWTQSCFKSGFWNAFWNAKKKGVLDRDQHRKPDSRTCERKALSERDSGVCILEMRAEAMLKPCMGQSVQTAQ